MIADTGCRRSVAGLAWHRAMQAACRRRGLSWKERAIKAEFVFGDSKSLKAETTYEHPVGIENVEGSSASLWCPWRSAPA